MQSKSKAKAKLRQSAGKWFDSLRLHPAGAGSAALTGAAAAVEERQLDAVILADLRLGYSTPVLSFSSLRATRQVAGQQGWRYSVLHQQQRAHRHHGPRGCGLASD